MKKKNVSMPNIEEREYEIEYKGGGWDSIVLVKNKDVIEFWNDGFDGYEHIFSIECTDFKKIEKKMLASGKRTDVECTERRFIHPSEHKPRVDAPIIKLSQFCKTSGKWYNKN